MTKIYPVLLSGGAGSRLWPLSRENNPKQFINLFGESSLFEATLKRCGNINFHNPTIVCANHQLKLVKDGLNNQNIKDASIILEPKARNTAPAVLAAALYLYSKDKDAIMLVMPSDHIIKNNDVFLRAAQIALKSANQGFLTTFGIKPEYPETGFGYIKKGVFVENLFAVEEFVEKPNLELAKQYLKSGNYFWNSGIFMFKAETLLTKMQKFEPEMVANCQKSFDNAKKQANTVYLETTNFALCKSISFDYAVMEKTSKATVVPVENSGWNDVGSYQALWEIANKDYNGNSCSSNSVLIDAANNLVKSETNQLVSLIGVKDLVVIVQDDIIMIVPKEKSQDVKKMVAYLKENNENTYL